MQTEISISSLLTILRNAWLKILIIVLVVTLSAGIFTTFFYRQGLFLKRKVFRNEPS